jgi:hypothetical protein
VNETCQQTISDKKEGKENFPTDPKVVSSN